MNAKMETTREVVNSVPGNTAYMPKMTKPHAVGVTNMMVVYYKVKYKHTNSILVVGELKTNQD